MPGVVSLLVHNDHMTRRELREVLDKLTETFPVATSGNAGSATTPQRGHRCAWRWRGHWSAGRRHPPWSGRPDNHPRSRAGRSHSGGAVTGLAGTAAQVAGGAMG